MSESATQQRRAESDLYVLKRAVINALRKNEKFMNVRTEMVIRVGAEELIQQHQREQFDKLCASDKAAVEDGKVDPCDCLKVACMIKVRDLAKLLDIKES